MLTRRKFIQTAAGIGLGLTLRPTRAFPKDDETVRIGYLPITDATPLLIAHALGYFQEEGLKAEDPVLIRNWSALSESFLSGLFNVVHLLLPIPIWMRYKNKTAVKVVAWNHTNGSALTVRPDSGIRGFADLGGKQIAVPYWYSMHNIILQMGLRRVSLKPVIKPQNVSLKPDEVNLFVLPPPEMPVSLAGRKVDGYIVAEPFNALGELKIGAKITRFSGDIWKNHPCCVVTMHEATVKSKPVFTQKVVNAVVRAQYWTQENPAQAAKILSRDGNRYLPMTEDVLSRVFTYYDESAYGKDAVPHAIRHPEWDMKRIGFEPYPYPSATRFIVNEMRETLMEGNTDFLKKLDTDFAAKDLVDETFARKSVDAIGGPSRFREIDIGHPWDREEVIEFE